MMYFEITKSSDVKIIGKEYPQCKGNPDIEPENWEYKLSLIKGLNNKTFPDSSLELLFELEETSKLTDVISPSLLSASGLLVSKKFKSILEKKRLPEHRFYNTIIRYETKEYRYYWLHLVKNNLEGINFKKSDFILTNLACKKLKTLEINSEEEYFNEFYKVGLKRIIANKLILDSEQYTDLIYFPYVLEPYLLVSEELIKEIEKYNITGLEIKSQDILL